MDFRELTYITTIADTGNVTAAAQKLYMSQPALSQILAKVEGELGVKLFRRGRGPLTLTYAGEIYIHAARKMLSTYADMKEEIADIAGGERGEIRIGVPVERSGFLLAPILPKFRKMYPKVQIRTVEGRGTVLKDLLEKDQVDFIILPFDEEIRDPDLVYEKIYTEKLTLVVNPSLLTPQMMESEHQVRLTEIAELPMICQKPGQSTRRFTDRLMKRFALSPSVAVETGSAISAVQLAVAGLGFAIVPERAPSVLHGNEDLKCFDFLPTPQTWEIHAIYRKDNYIDNFQRSLIDLMKRETQSFDSSLIRK